MEEPEPVFLSPGVATSILVIPLEANTLGCAQQPVRYLQPVEPSGRLYLVNFTSGSLGFWSESPHKLALKEARVIWNKVIRCEKYFFQTLSSQYLID